MAKPSDYSPGGQVYDRTTGTWAGENTRSVGEDMSSPGRGTFVIHDANGPVGVHLAGRPRMPDGPGAGVTSNGVRQSGSPSIGASVTGPGAPAVASSTGGGALAATAGIKLKPKMQPTFTQLSVGGSPIVHHPGWSDAGEAEERYGDGDSMFSPTFVYQWGVAIADVYATGADYLRRKGVLGVSPEQRKANAEAIGGFFMGNPMDPIQNGHLVQQQPVDWGL